MRNRLRTSRIGQTLFGKKNSELWCSAYFGGGIGCLLRFALLVSLSHFLHGQIDTCTFLGKITRENGIPAANVRITLLRTDTNETVYILTDEKGFFRRDGLRVGRYHVRIFLEGFRTEVRRDLVLLVGESLRIDFQLQPGNSEEELIAQGDESSLGGGRTDLGQVINQEKLETLPLNNRDFEKLVRLASGAAPSSNNQMGSVQVMGMRFKDNLTYIDGTLFTHGDGATTFTASTDAMQEFNVKTGLYSAEFGVRPGGQITAVTRSGGNDFHGNLFWFHRNDNLDARSFFEQNKSEFKRNQVGGTLGGPILVPGLFNGRDHAWFFGSFQFRSIRKTKPLTGVVPTAEEKQGQFIGSITDPSTGQPFFQNRIPLSRIDRVATKLLSFWSLPNTPGLLNFTSPDSTSNQDNPQVIARIDFRTSQSSRWAGRFIWDASPIASAHIFSIFSAVQPLSTYGQTISNTRSIGSVLSNSASIHWFFRSYVAGPSNPKPELPLSLGIPELLVSKVDQTGVPKVEVQGISGIGDVGVLGHANLGNWQVKDDISLGRGNHTFRAGVEFRQHYNFYVMQRRSKFEFYDRYTGNSFADFLLGYPVRTELGSEDFRGNFHQNSLYCYVTDTWRASNQLTLSMGLRYELRFPWRDKRGFMSNFDPVKGKLFPQLLSSALTAGKTGRFEPGYPLVSWNKISGVLPRLGASLRISDQTVIRSGYGIYSNEPDLNMIQEMAKNPRPGARRLAFLAPLDNPVISLSQPFPKDLIDSAAPNRSGMENILPMAATHSWGLSFEHRLVRHLRIHLGYHGSHSSNRLETVSINDAMPGIGDRQDRRPFPHLQTVELPFADADAWFHGLHLQVEKSPDERGFSALIVFDWSKQIETGGGYQGPPARRRFRSRNMLLVDNRALSEFHVPRRLVVTSGYELPFGPRKTFFSEGFLSKILSGWSFRSIVSLQDGGWYTIYLPGDSLDTGSYHSQWPDRIRNPNLPDAQRTRSRWFDTEAFVKPLGYEYGNAGRSSVEGPGTFNLDLSFSRTFNFQTSRRLELRLEAFNAINRSNFILTGSSKTGEYGTPNFGVLGESQPGRQIQLAVKYYY